MDIKAVAAQEKTFARATERGLRTLQGCVVLAMALNHKQFSLLGRTVDLAQVKSWTEWTRFGIYSHMILHDALDAWNGGSDWKGSAAGHAVITGLLLHESGIFPLDKKIDMLHSAFDISFFSGSVAGLLKGLETWQNDKRGHVEFAQSCADSLLWMPAALFGLGEKKLEGVAAIVTGGLGLYNFCFPSGKIEDK